MSRSKIEWTTMTYNPWAGCSKVSPGCANCYAERMAKRLKAMDVPHYQDVVDENGWTGILRARREGFPRLPGESAAPKMIFVGSMTDIFHEQPSDAAIRELFFHMLASGGKNTFQILTKRIDRAVEFFDQHFELGGNPKFWIGVSVCNQKEAEEKIPELLKINAAVRFVSVEPMLGPVNLSELPRLEVFHQQPYGWERWLARKLHWVICGGESGPGARPMHPDWPRRLRDQCVAAGVPCFFKQWGEWKPICPLYAENDEELLEGTREDHQLCMQANGAILLDGRDESPLYQPDSTAWILERVGKKKAGRELDGKVWDEYPETLGALL